MPAPRIHLVCWNDEEAAAQARLLRAAGYRVVTDRLSSIVEIRKLRDDPPAAVVIDLDRIPSQGCAVGVAIRSQKATRHVPLVFVGGLREKTARTRALLPDASYTTWRDAGKALALALSRPVAQPVRPASVMAQYAGAPLPKKLGFKPGAVIWTIDAPRDFATLAAPLPEGLILRAVRAGRLPARNPAPDLLLWFVKTRKNLDARIAAIARAVTEGGGLWIAWPKKAAGGTSDLSFREVQKAGLSHGLVDFKIVAINAVWSGLRFARKHTRG